jgi:anti-sigma regulatory factor (Ser/Thr protein kinase)
MSQICIPVTESSQPSAARRAALNLAHEAKLDEAAVGGVALIVTELATNLVKHATGGQLLLRRLGPGGDEGVEALSLDKGPGIADVTKALSDGYSTAGSPGTGLGSLMRTAGEFDLYSQPGKGTAVVARIFSRGRQAPPSTARSLGVVHQPKQGEAECGDDWIVRWFADGWACAVADGLGHGAFAAAAARAAIGAVRTANGGRRPLELVEAAHEAAKPTRGAAFGVAVLDGGAGMVRFAGVGNVAALVMDGDQRRNFVSYNGILGHSYRSLSEFTHPWNPPSVLIFHTDGIATQWDLKQYPGLPARDPSLIAGVLYRDYARGRDDATVVVVKERDGQE